jgi:hypothetical protein
MHYTNGSGAATRIPVITGASLVHRQLTPQQKAVWCADILDGLATYVPTQKELADNIGVSVAYVMAARRLSPGKRALVLQGYDAGLPALVNSPQRRPALPKPNGLTDAALENLARQTPDRLWRALEAAESRVAAE